jgi:hypothetical protein
LLSFSKSNEIVLNLDVFKQQLIEVKYIFNSKISLFGRLIIKKKKKNYGIIDCRNELWAKGAKRGIGGL